MVYELAMVTGLPALLGMGARWRSKSWYMLGALLVVLAAAFSLFYYLAAMPMTPRSIFLFCLSLAGGVLGFLSPGVWRNMVAPNILTIVFWTALGGYIYYAWNYLPGAEFAAQIASVRRPLDYVLWFAAKTDEPLLVAAVIFGATGLAFKIIRGWMDRFVGRMLGGNC